MSIIQDAVDSVGNIPLPGLPGGANSAINAGKVVGKTGIPQKVNDDLAKDDKVKNPDAREFLKSVGWPDSEIENAAAVVYRESRGKCNAHNHNTNGTWDKGLFQINDVWVKAGIISDTDRDDCTKGAKAALEIFQKSGWGPWYSSGCTGAPAQCTPAPKGFKISGTVTSKDSLTGSVADAAKSAASPFTAVAGFLAQLMNADTWFRIAKVAFGGIILVMAIEVFMNKTGMGSMAPSKLAPKVVPIPI